MTEPLAILMVVKAHGCPACTVLDQNWSKLELEIRQNFPNIVIHTLTLNNTQNLYFDPKIYPQDLRSCIYFFPSFILIPGTVWSRATRIMGANNPVSIQGYARVFNIKYQDNGYPVFENEKLVQEGANIYVNNGLSNWIRSLVNNPKFIRPNLNKLDEAIQNYGIKTVSKLTKMGENIPTKLFASAEVLDDNIYQNISASIRRVDPQLARRYVTSTGYPIIFFRP